LTNGAGSRSLVNMSTTAEPRPNRYADDCAACDEWVAPGAGHLYNIDGNWVVTCDTCEPPSIVPTAPNNRDGACETCGVWVPAGAGAWMGARGVQCARHAAMDAYDAQRDYEAAEQRCRNADHQRTATYAALRHAVRLPANPAEYDAWTPAGRARAAERRRGRRACRGRRREQRHRLHPLRRRRWSRILARLHLLRLRWPRMGGGVTMTACTATTFG
jgi:hypothetical protein